MTLTKAVMVSENTCCSEAISRARWPATWFSARLVLARVCPPRQTGWVTVTSAVWVSSVYLLVVLIPSTRVVVSSCSRP